MEGLCGILVFAVAVAASVAVTFIGVVIQQLLVKPLQLRRYYEHQGLKGPPPKPIFGNSLTVSRMIAQAQSAPMSALSHDIVSRVFPHYNFWVHTYGKQFLFWLGNKPQLSVADPELLKEILSNRNGAFLREPVGPNSQPRMLLGGGLLSLSGHTWTKHRKILNPAFHLGRLKGIIPTVCESCELVLQSWAESTEVDVQKEFRRLTGDVISRRAFGSNYEQSRHIFGLMAQQTVLIMMKMVPGISLYLPSKTKRECFGLDKEIRQHIKGVIRARLNMDAQEHSSRDLLGLMLEAAKSNHEEQHLSREEIVDECKTFYLTGQETLASHLSWTIILLAMHPEWQEKARQEVLQVFPRNVNSYAGKINSLRTVGMILNESLRLYPPAMFLKREVAKDTELGNLSVRAGTQIFIPVLYVHHDAELWGEDVNEFNPERFRDGPAKAAKHLLSFLPVGFGPMTCIGQNFAIIEAKTVLAMILQRFSFELSPSYSHAPAARFLPEPQYGAQVILRKI